MAAIDFKPDVKFASATLAAIDAAVLRTTPQDPRAHLGASVLGGPCDRALWYTFRWATRPVHGARMLRLFARGQDEEERLVRLLRAAGITVHTIDENTGAQFTFSAVGGHVGGSMDGACIGVPDAPKAWHVLEFKTHGTKSFRELQSKGVKAAKPMHWSQCQAYLGWTGMTRALYIAVCKETDELHIERIDADKAAFDSLMARAERIVRAPVPPERLSDDADHFVCRFCDHRAACHGTAAPLPTCRSCAHATPEPDGNARWSCAKHGKDLTVPEQRAGCEWHRFIPMLLANFASAVDAEGDDVRYALRDGSGEFVNGTRPGFSSAEIHACEHKRMLADEQLIALRNEWEGEVVA